jgi:hypothetical protein
MTRPVTADHVLFKECIPAFRPLSYDPATRTNTGGDKRGYLLLGFESSTSLKLGDFTMHQSHTVAFQGGREAYVAPVTLPPWTQPFQAHLFTTSLSAAVSFASDRPASSPRDSYISSSNPTDQQLQALALHLPILAAGPGALQTRLSQAHVSAVHEAIDEVVRILFALPYPLYEQVLRAMRLVQLSHLNRRIDFALAYYLLVSAIECLATQAVRRKEVKDQPPKEPDWRERAKSDEDFRELLDEYLEHRGQNQYRSRRFIRFILDYCPPELWDEMPHPSEAMASLIEESIDGIDLSWMTERKPWREVYPSDLPLKLPDGAPPAHRKFTIHGILSDTYRHRSQFTHEGSDPPHLTPTLHNWYFETVPIYRSESCQFDVCILPTIDLLAFIARRSILSYCRTHV